MKHPVWVIFRRRAPPSVTNFVHGRAGQKAENGVGITSFRAKIGGLDPAELHFAEAEMGSDLFQELKFRIAHVPIGGGDVEKSVEHVLQEAGPRAVLAADLLRVGIKS